MRPCRSILFDEDWQPSTKESRGVFAKSAKGLETFRIRVFGALGLNMEIPNWNAKVFSEGYRWLNAALQTPAQEPLSTFSSR